MLQTGLQGSSLYALYLSAQVQIFHKDETGGIKPIHPFNVLSVKLKKNVYQQCICYYSFPYIIARLNCIYL